jgi:hypothetical protein
MKRIIFLLTVIAIIGILMVTYPVISSFISPTSQLPVYKESYGSYIIMVYDQGNLSLVKHKITGLMLVINNIDQEKLGIAYIENSTSTFNVNYFFAKESVVLNNGDVTTAYVNTTEIYIGETTIIIPIQLSPGTYTVLLNDGNFFSVTIS